jgi:hypothetical protein
MQRCHELGLEPERAGLATLDEFWNEAKAIERGKAG